MSYFNPQTRFDDSGFKQARAQPFKQEAQVKIAVEGKRYMSPEKKDVYVRFPDGPHNRQPFLPRHTPAHAFPPPGSDIRRHGATDFIVSGSNIYNSRDPSGMVNKLCARLMAGIKCVLCMSILLFKIILWMFQVG